MTKLLKLVFAAAVAMTLTSTTATASVAKGQKLYIKKMKEVCGMNGAKMAAKHTQDEWEKIYNAGKLNEELKSICGKETKEKYLPHMFDFFYEYASDSGNVPAC
jgi:Spy/CpxP family protein refolding chaperone